MKEPGPLSIRVEQLRADVPEQLGWVPARGTGIKREKPITGAGGVSPAADPVFLFLDGRADDVAPFRPRAVVVLHVVVAQQVLEYEPGMG